MEKTSQQLSVNSADCLNNIKCDTTSQTGPFKCAVLQCQNKFVDFETHQQSPFKFHSFPTDSKHAQRWKELCKVPANSETTNLKVCSDHFRFSDYIVNRKALLLNPNYKQCLREHALPLLNIGACTREGKKSVATVSTESQEKGDLKVELEVTKLKNNIQELKKRNTWRKQIISRKEKQIETIKKVIPNIDKTIESSRESRDRILKELFSETQINLLKGSTKKIFWTDDDLAQAFTIRHMGGKDVYLFLKNTLNYPLPALGCVQAWAANN